MVIKGKINIGIPRVNNYIAWGPLTLTANQRKIVIVCGPSLGPGCINRSNRHCSRGGVIRAGALANQHNGMLEHRDARGKLTEQIYPHTRVWADDI